MPSIHYAIYVLSINPLRVDANSATTSTPILSNEHYHLNEYHVGLSYLAIGTRTVVG